MSSTAPLSPSAADLDRYRAIEADFDAIKARYRARLGPADVAYIRGLRRSSRLAEAAGRGLLWFGRDPVTFVLGVGLLWLHRNLEAIEIGHNVLHGQYDYFPEIPQFHAHQFKWKTPVDEEAWRREHNGQHHVHTNVYEKDPDLNHGILRMNDRQPWNPYHRFQFLGYFLTGYPGVLYSFNDQNLGFYDEFRAAKFPEGNTGYALVHPGGDRPSRRRRHWLAVGRIVAKEYVAMPLLAWATGHSAARVALGNLAADVLNNYWIGLTIQSTHLTEPLQPEEMMSHKGRWYLSQMDATVNFKGSRRMSILWGHLNYQIEHHLFPDIPSRHYPDMAKEVKAVCTRHGIPYKCNDNWWQAIRNVARAMRHYAKPPAAIPAVAAAGGSPTQGGRHA